MLRKIRISLAAISLAALAALFLDFTGSIHAYLAWMAKIQFIPAALALNVGVVAFLVILTLLFGRVYCSVICPLGIFQDILARLNRKKHRFSYSPALSPLRYSILAVFIIAIIAGIGSLVALLDPYSAFGRIVSNLFAPIYQLANNLLALLAERANSYAFYSTDVWLKSLPTFLIALATLIALVILAWRNGRTYCNAICPVGTLLGLLSRFSLFRPVIDANKCKNCSLCSRSCKSSCINYKAHEIDYNRCVACMNCIDSCKHGALHFQSRFKKQADAPANSNRRSFLSLSAMLAASSVVKAQEKVVDGGLTVLEDKVAPKRQTPILPPGSISANRFARLCTGCQLCVSVCPNEVLRPSTNLLSLMQPEMSFERGYCRPECNRCSTVCPSGAISPISVEEKTAIHLGHAVWLKQNCIPLTDGVECGNCARHCPSEAIIMVPSEDNPSVKVPVVNIARCIGCGACENLCPARPLSAIYVEGYV